MDELFQEVQSGRLPGADDPALLTGARDRRGQTLLHVCLQESVMQGLLDLGIDPNSRDQLGLTPLMRFQLSADCTRLLLEAGADANATDERGVAVLSHQAGVSICACGYCRPNFEALDLLLAAGATPPDAEQARNWIEGANEQVCSAGEASDATAFERWVMKVVR